MLTLAWVYRTGRDLLAPRSGLFATLLLSTSVFFLSYMIHARAFTLIALVQHALHLGLTGALC